MEKQEIRENTELSIDSYVSIYEKINDEELNKIYNITLDEATNVECNFSKTLLSKKIEYEIVKKEVIIDQKKKELKKIEEKIKKYKESVFFKYFKRNKNYKKTILNISGYDKWEIKFKEKNKTLTSLKKEINQLSNELNEIKLNLEETKNTWLNKNRSLFKEKLEKLRYIEKIKNNRSSFNTK